MRAKCIVVIGCVLGFSSTAPAQSFLRGSGRIAFDSELSSLSDIAEVSAGYNYGLARRSTGEVIGWGQNEHGQCHAPEFGAAPATQLAAGYTHSMILRSDGTVVGFGLNTNGQLSLPPVPSGLVWTKVAAGPGYSLALRSDGVAVMVGGFVSTHPVPNWSSYVDIAAGFSHAAGRLANGGIVLWGPQHNLGSFPAPPTGQTFTRVVAGSGFTAGLLSGGMIVVHASSTNSGVQNVPALPPGVTYTALAAGYRDVVALRSDGQIVAWPSTHYTPPPLPPGVTWADLSMRGFTVIGRRSDGRIEIWPEQAWNWFSTNFVPAHPPGRAYVRIAAGGDYGTTNTEGAFTLALDAGGGLLAWGANLYDVCVVPQLPPGVFWTDIAAGADHTVPDPKGGTNGAGHALGLDSTGDLHAWGLDRHGQCGVPALPPGTTYSAMAAGGQLSVALRSDGQAVAFGNIGAPPPLPTGTSYVELAAGHTHAIARRSDGVVVGWGSLPGGVDAPAPPPGLVYVQIDSGRLHNVALRSDGVAVRWGGQSGIIAPPAGQYFVEVSATRTGTLLRRSDGRITTRDHVPPLFVRPLPNHLSAVEVDGGGGHVVIRVGPRRSYSRIGDGCAGSLSAARLVPRDTPAIGRPFELRLHDLPVGAAFLITGSDRLSSSIGPLPLALDPFGLPGCTAYVRDDVVTLLGGSGTQATTTIAVPNHPALLGLSVYQQAVVIDPQAGNPAQAVMSEAMEAVIGL